MNLGNITTEHINSQFEVCAIVKGVTIRTASNNKNYADVELQNASGTASVRVWNSDSVDQALLTEGRIVKMTIKVSTYQGSIQLIYVSGREAQSVEYELEEITPSSRNNTRRMEMRLHDHIDKIATPSIRTLIDRTVVNHLSAYSIWPAASKVHHSYMSGLLQHVLEVLETSLALAYMKYLPQRQIDRVIAIALLHDYGKLREYSGPPSMGITVEGRMYGHIFIGAHEVMNMINTIEDFDKEDELVIINGILSHHGRLEWGSPVEPKTVEAQIVHHADLLSGRVEAAQMFIEEHAKQSPNKSFTDKLWTTGHEFFVPKQEQDEET